MLRASNYYRTAEFFLTPDDRRRLETYEKSCTLFRHAMAEMGVRVEPVQIPYDGTTLPGYFYRVDDRRSPRPLLVSLGGFDSTGEELYFFAAAAALRRGYNCLTFEGPGQGEPLRRQHLPARPDYEVPVRAALDYLWRRPEVDRERVALMGTSLGGYYAGRAAAFEPRVRALIIHGAVLGLWAAQAHMKQGLARVATWRSPRRVEFVLQAVEQLNNELRWSLANGQWVFGVASRNAVLQTIQQYTLKPVVKQIHCPTLILHGQQDHFIPVEQAEQLYAALTSPKTLRVFTAEEGAEEHCQIGNLGLMQQVAFDWLDEIFAAQFTIGGAERLAASEIRP